MFPIINYDETSSVNEEKKLGYVLKFDYDTRQFIFVDGKPVGANYEEAIKQWISQVLVTEQSKYKIYADLEFGLSINQFIGRKDIPIATINSEVRRQIEEQLLQHSEIVSVNDFTFERANNAGVVSFSVTTRNGTLIEGIESEVSYIG